MCRHCKRTIFSGAAFLGTITVSLVSTEDLQGSDISLPNLLEVTIILNYDLDNEESSFYPAHFFLSILLYENMGESTIYLTSVIGRVY